MAARNRGSSAANSGLRSTSSPNGQFLADEVIECVLRAKRVFIAPVALTLFNLDLLGPHFD